MPLGGAGDIEGDRVIVGVALGFKIKAHGMIAA